MLLKARVWALSEGKRSFLERPPPEMAAPPIQSAFLPALAGETVNALYAGLRPATQFKDYQVEALPERNWITVAGILPLRAFLAYVGIVAASAVIEQAGVCPQRSRTLASCAVACCCCGCLSGR